MTLGLQNFSGLHSLVSIDSRCCAIIIHYSWYICLMAEIAEFYQS